MKKEFITKFAMIITGAFSFLAALAWNETIKTFIQRYISPGKGLKSMLIYAVTVTIIAIVVSVYINKAADKFTKKQEKLEKKVDKLEDELEKRDKK